MFRSVERLLLDKDIKKYHFVSQGKTEIPGVDDKEEHLVTDVSKIFRNLCYLKKGSGLGKIGLRGQSDWTWTRLRMESLL